MSNDPVIKTNNMIDVENLQCNYCDKTYKTRSELKSHTKAKYHLQKVKDAGDEIYDWTIKVTIQQKHMIERHKNTIKKDGKCYIPLNTIDKRYAVVSEDVYEELRPHTISGNNRDEYVDIMVDGVSYYLHRYIYYNLYNRAPRLGYVIDHFDREPSNNCTENLQESNYTTNALNKTKAENKSSIYKGVSKIKDKNKWECQIHYQDETYRFRYDNELHAAYHYNLLLIDLNINAPYNAVEKPDDFILHIVRGKNSELPTGIFLNGRYCYTHKGTYYYFDSLEETINQRDIYLESQKIEKINNIVDPSFKRDTDGIPIIELCNNKEEIVQTILVDAHRYHELKLNTLHRVNKNYVNIITTTQEISLGRYLLNCIDPLKYVDHRDNNPNNYQMNNLKIVSQLHNAQNKSSAKDSTSQYIGVFYNKNNNKWISQINNEQIGQYDIEFDAGQKRDMRAYELNLLGNYFKINLPVELQCNLFIKALSEENFDFNCLYY